MAPDALAQVLRPLAMMFPAERFPQLLAGLEVSDDAAVYRISDELALVATLDFITPIVDDPYQFGAIAAANSLSDVYAMGGRPILALNVCCFPRCLPRETIAEILRGGAEKVVEAGAALVGGHTVDDEEPKYGLVALGFVHPDDVLRKSGAQPGDVLVLTKPLGVGIVTTASKADQARAEDVNAAIESMLKLNATAVQLLQRHVVHACTDITGFALLGHSCEMAEKSGVLLRIDADAVPFLPGAREYADAWLFPGGTGRNRTAYADQVQFAENIHEEMRQLLFTPETSGGLLAAVPRTCLDDLKAAFNAANEPLWEIGEVLEGAGITVVARPARHEES
jgi:selenide,water dikinase